jgi:hypothetical protein
MHKIIHMYKMYVRPLDVSANELPSSGGGI